MLEDGVFHSHCRPHVDYVGGGRTATLETKYKRHGTRGWGWRRKIWRAELETVQGFLRPGLLNLLCGADNCARAT